eukprot:scaffold2469_cov130-Amphora_coffeaeformis.AAC.2
MMGSFVDLINAAVKSNGLLLHNKVLGGKRINNGLEPASLFSSFLKMPTSTDGRSQHSSSGGSSLLYSSRGGFRGHRADVRTRPLPTPAPPPIEAGPSNNTTYPVVIHSTSWMPPMPQAPLGRPPYVPFPPERAEALPWPLLRIIPPRAPPIVNNGHGEPMYCLHGPTIYVMRPLAELGSLGMPTSDPPNPVPQSLALAHSPGYPISMPGAPAPVVYHDPSRFVSSSQIIIPPSNQRAPALARHHPEQQHPQPVKSSTYEEKKPPKARAPRKPRPPKVKTEERAYRKGIKYQNDSFPMKLHRLLLRLEGTHQSDIAGFSEDGKSFYIHDKVGLEKVLPTVFRHGQFLSFKRLLYMYGFECIQGSWTKGTFRHPQFCRNDPDECRHMVRINSTAEKMGYNRGRSGVIDNEKKADSSNEETTKQET